MDVPAIQVVKSADIHENGYPLAVLEQWMNALSKV